MKLSRLPVNNAAQTIRRPPAFYQHLIATELLPVNELPEQARNLVKLNFPASLENNSNLQLESSNKHADELAVAQTTVDINQAHSSARCIPQ